MEPGSAEAGVAIWTCDQCISALKGRARQATALEGKVTPESLLEPRAVGVLGQLSSHCSKNRVVKRPRPTLSRSGGDTALSSGSPSLRRTQHGSQGAY